MNRSVLVVILASAAALGGARAASADQPSRQPLLNADGVVSGTCSFPVGIHILEQNEYSLTFDNGVQLVTGRLFVRLTNLDSGTSLEVNVSGPSRTTANQDGTMSVRLLGASLVFDLGPGGPSGLFLTSGPVDLLYSATGAVVGAVQLAPSANRDLCAALA